MNAINIPINIRKTKDNNLETEWASNFMMEGIIKGKTSSLLRMYSYKESGETEEIKNKMRWICARNIVAFIISTITLSGSIIAFVYMLFEYPTTTSTLLSVIIALCGAALLITMIFFVTIWFIMVFFCYRQCVEMFIELKELNIKNKNKYYEV
jgi:NAD/NADP transhydrogenase beta subunit